MPRSKKHSAEQIIAKLRTAEVEMSKGRTTAQAAKNIGVTEQTYYRWRKEQFLTSGKGRPPQLPTGPQLHPRYRSFESSGLSFTVTTHKKENHFQIVVEQR